MECTQPIRQVDELSELARFIIQILFPIFGFTVVVGYFWAERVDEDDAESIRKGALARVDVFVNVNEEHKKCDSRQSK